MRLYPTTNLFVKATTTTGTTTSTANNNKHRHNNKMSNMLNGMDDEIMFHAHWRLRKRKPTPQVDKAAIFKEQERLRVQLTSQLKHLGAWEGSITPTKRPMSSGSSGVASSNHTVSTKSSWSSSTSGSRSLRTDADSLSTRAHLGEGGGDGWLPDLAAASYGKPSDVGKTFEGYEKKRICVDAPRISSDVPVVYPFITEGWKADGDGGSSGGSGEKKRPHSAPARRSSGGGGSKQYEESQDDLKNRQFGKKSEIGKLFVTPGGKRISPTRNESTVFLGGRL